MKVLALIFDGFEEEEAIAPFDILKRAGVSLTIASNNTTVTSSHQFKLTDIANINDINYKEYDALFIPGGPHYKFLYTYEYGHEIIRYFFLNNKYVFGICAAPTLFGRLGFLKNKKYTCFTSMNDDFGGTFTNQGVCKDGYLITAKSVAYSLDFAYEMVLALMGKEVLNKVLDSIYYEK